jgi:hypothetical protein
VSWIGAKYLTSSKQTIKIKVSRVSKRHARNGRTGAEEHVTDRCSLLVDSEGVAGEQDAFRDDACRIRIEEAAHRDEMGCCQGESAYSMREKSAWIVCTLRIFTLAKEHARLLTVHDRAVRAGNMGTAVPEVPLELVHVVRALATAPGVLAVCWSDSESTWANAEDERVLRANTALVFGVALDREMKHSLLVLVWEKAKQHVRCW